MKKIKLKPCSIKWTENFMKKEGFKPISEERLKNDPFLRKMVSIPKT